MILSYFSEILISKEAVSEIIDVINKTLADPDSPELELRSRMGAQLATTLPQDYHDQNFSRLLVNLFHLNVLVPVRTSRAGSLYLRPSSEPCCPRAPITLSVGCSWETADCRRTRGTKSVLPGKTGSVRWFLLQGK